MGTDLTAIGQRAKQAARQLGRAGTERKNTALIAIAQGLAAQQSEILAANTEDVADARIHGLDAALIDRLTLTPARLNSMAADVRKVVDLPDPVGEEFDARRLPNGLHLSRRRVPIGVLGVIYEARPNVTVDVATLCLKTGNACILRGGKETMRSNQALTEVIQAAMEQVGLPADAVQSIQDPDRAIVAGLLRLHDYVDMIIPRGGAALHQFCREHATIPVITGGIGVCHLYIDDTADLNKAVEIVYNAKVQRPSVCNALDTLLVNQAVSERFLALVARRLAEADVVLHVDPEASAILEQAQTNIQFVPAVAGDFDREWLSLHLGVRVLSSLDEALEHIAAHSTQHSDGILTDTWSHAQRFLDEVDSAAVFVNASTRFNDGGQFGLGAEVAISTQKLHARGPMGLQELTTYKWIVLGDGHVRP